MEFWKDKEKGIVNAELFSKKAEEIVISLTSVNKWEKIEKELDKNQIRKFYNDVLTIKSKINSSENIELEFERQKPYLNMLRAKVAYARSRKHIRGDNFVLFITNSLNEVNDVQDFKVFCSLYEAVIAYFGN
ncbi:MAG: type III-A CRISPR-associated protein Csm2 [Candidatus Margulisbacteria bacterium]|nr:type III-A CRISPR-associated protein Csm2 [Candidatus Margulisiibacteriota bacterium]